MFASFDYSKFPIIYIKLNNNIKNNEDFNDFINKWSDLNNNKNNYELVFDTQCCEIINPKYCLYDNVYKKIKKRKNNIFTKK